VRQGAVIPLRRAIYSRMPGLEITEKRPRLPIFAKGLSARLLMLTIAFVMLAEVLIYAPSIGRFRLVFLEERLATAHLAILTLEATPDQMVSEELERELMSHVGAYMVALKKPGSGKLMLMVDAPSKEPTTFDLRNQSFVGLIRDAFATLLGNGMGLLRVVGPSPKDQNVLVEILIDEKPLRDELLDFSWRILALSLVISLFTAALVYLSLHLMMVRPMRRLTDSMTKFREDPENPEKLIEPSSRADEIGVAERELLEMQEGLRASLVQKTRLAALGTAVNKINHDLRNMLSTARLVSDRLAHSGDPDVQRITPTLVNTIDHAVRLCTQTLDFAQEGPPTLHLTTFSLRDLVAEVGHDLPLSENGEFECRNHVEEALLIEGDREQFFRVFLNLGTNAVQAGATRLDVSAREVEAHVIIEFADNGPGLPPRARDKLFTPFEGSARRGGTGLGLAISRELLRAHGGDIRLEESTSDGTRFLLVLPVAQNERGSIALCGQQLPERGAAE